MLEARRLRREPEAIAQSLKKRGIELDLAKLGELEKARHDLQTETESLQHQRNVASKEIGEARREGLDIEPLVAAVSDLGFRLDAVKQEFQKVQVELNEFLLTIPNIPDESVPEGMDEDDNEELRSWGERPSFNFVPRDHVDLASTSLDLDAAAKITGTRYSVIRGPLAKLHRSLIQFMLNVHIEEHGYEELYVPYIVNRETMTATGQLPKFEEDLFRIAGDEDHFLIPTAEVPVTSMVRDQILDADDLPLKFVSHTPCFRSEAGSHGKDTRGLVRQHQFEKVELVHVVEPSRSWEALDELTGHAESILQRLELPYRAVALCGGDLGFSAAKTIDLEVWLPGFERFREISSCSNFLDFQARRSHARYRPGPGSSPELVHTLNGSGLAVGRTMIAIMENYQDGEGRVHVPDVLQRYMGGVKTLTF